MRCEKLLQVTYWSMRLNSRTGTKESLVSSLRCFRPSRLCLEIPEKCSGCVTMAAGHRITDELSHCA